MLGLFKFKSRKTRANRRNAKSHESLKYVSSVRDEIAVDLDCIHSNDLVQVAKNIKEHGGVGPIRVHLSENDSINRTRKKSAKLIEYLSR